MPVRTIFVSLFLTAVCCAADLQTEVDQYLFAAAQRPAGDKPWEIQANVGIAVTQGNSRTFNFTSGFDAKKVWDPWTLKLKESSVYSRSEGVESGNQHIFTERLERALTHHDSIFQQLLLEHDERAKLNILLQPTFGYQRLLVQKGDTLTLTGDIGGGFLYQKFRYETQTEGIAQIGADLSWHITKQLHLHQAFTVYPSLSDIGQYRFVSTTELTTPVGDHFDARLAIVDQYDSSPQAGVKKNDLLLTVGLVIHFTKAKKS